ncbi:peptide deformylase [Dechloromonas sp. TW-R-39-2]|uniref:peptide deformylase n=1 Tax=Dechloromonas sp. TW-R-39-2 TaxID=2654218 RepID=UPI00193CCB4C|nr:peptide deformylase [Dechloromonas sp. TW-R-39-2]QRM20020.1 peptide deformylase [Dechloromonas sp. TW-R-39-2]
MAVRTILRMGDPRLLVPAQPVTDFATPALAELIDDMFDTMAAAGGVGLAAPQIGVGLQVVIFGFEQSERYPDADAVPQTILINPVITPLSTAQEAGWEGCLSVPGLRGEVPRFPAIRYQGFDPSGQPIDRSVEGFHARVVQHECDHLIGMLYPMRMRDFSRFGFTDVLFPEMGKES